MKSRSLCAQRKKAQRLPLGHCLGTHTPGPRTSGENWMFFEADGCVAGDRSADRDANMFALGPEDIPPLD